MALNFFETTLDCEKPIVNDISSTITLIIYLMTLAHVPDSLMEISSLVDMCRQRGPQFLQETFLNRNNIDEIRALGLAGLAALFRPKKLEEIENGAEIINEAFLCITKSTYTLRMCALRVLLNGI